MLINYTACHVLEGEKRGDRRKEKEKGCNRGKGRDGVGVEVEVREAGCTVKGEEIGMGRIERVQGDSGTEAETLRSGLGEEKGLLGGEFCWGHNLRRPRTEQEKNESVEQREKREREETRKLKEKRE